MTNRVKKFARFEDADPNSVIVTLFSCNLGFVRGWYTGPVSLDPETPNDWYTSPRDNVLGALALVRAVAIARRLNTDVNIVDPDDLWGSLSHD